MAQIWQLLTVLESDECIDTVSVMLSEAKHLWYFVQRRITGSEILRFAQNDNKGRLSCFRVANWICASGFAKTLEPQETGIAFAARETFGCRIVTTLRE